MSADNLDVYMPVVILVAMAILMVVVALLVSKLIHPNHPSKFKSTPYECGEDPIGGAWSNFNVRFYVTALIFIVFDVEGALMFPVAAIFKRFNEIDQGGIVLVTFLLFISVLVEGIVYCWKKGDLDWIRSYQLHVVRGEKQRSEEPMDQKKSA